MNKALFSSASCEWETPQELYDKLNDEFNFDLDPCATPENAKCKIFYTKEDDGLKKKWGGGTEYSATLHMVESCVNGSRNALNTHR